MDKEYCVPSKCLLKHESTLLGRIRWGKNEEEKKQQPKGQKQMELRKDAGCLMKH